MALSSKLVIYFSFMGNTPGYFSIKWIPWCSEICVKLRLNRDLEIQIIEHHKNPAMFSSKTLILTKERMKLTS